MLPFEIKMSYEEFKDLDLQLGEIPCDNCIKETGNGFLEDIRFSHPYHCPKCNGEGKVNWVENVFK